MECLIVAGHDHFATLSLGDVPAYGLRLRHFLAKVLGVPSWRQTDADLQTLGDEVDPELPEIEHGIGEL